MPVLRRALALVAPTVLLLSTAAVATQPEPTPAVPEGDGALRQQIDPDQVVVGEDAVLDRGHVDLGPRNVDGRWTLLVHDDTRVEGSVWRPLDNVAVHLGDAAVQQVPDDEAYTFLGVDPGTGVHVLPQTQDPDIAWLGWNTQDPSVLSTVDRGVTLSMADVEGPGHVVVYLQDGGFGEPDVLWDSRKEAPGDLWVDVNTHTHANWVFSEPGVYLVSITASADLVDGSEATTTGTLRLAVGQDTDPQQALSAAAPEDAEASAGSGAEDDSSDSGAVDDPGGKGDGAAAVWPWALLVAALVVMGLLIALLARGRRARRLALADRDDASDQDVKS